MTVKVYIWKGKIPFASAYNGLIFKRDAGHAAIEIFDGSKSLCYISHQFDEEKHLRGLTESEITEKKFYGEFPKLDNVNFEYDCREYNRYPETTINLYGLDERRMIEAANKYFNNELVSKIIIKDKEYTIPRYKYQLCYNNCCSIVAYFIRLGMGCPKDSNCHFCYPNGNVSPRRKVVEGGLNVGAALTASLVIQPLTIPAFVTGFFTYAGIQLVREIISFGMDIEQYGMNLRNARELFWSPITLEKFVKRVKENKACREE
ncbi:hypothetical protein NIES2101_41525 [Calothrix sp. HK-06]|nr:hypothetical protein NIES2101_41525 [Calothrix sp. HK-06]